MGTRRRRIVVLRIARHERLGWSIVEVLRLLAHAVMALILQTSLDTSRTWAFVAFINQLLSYALDPQLASGGLTTSEMRSLAGETGATSLLTAWT